MQMWTLRRFLPLVIGHLVPEDSECLLDLVFACPVAKSVCGDLEAVTTTLLLLSSTLTHQLQ